MWFEETVWGDWISSLMQHRHRSEADTFFFSSPSSPRGHFGLLWRPPAERERESEPLPSRCRYTLPPQTQTKCSFMSESSARLHLHMRFRAALQISCICHPAVWMRWVPWIFAHPGEAGVGGASICFLNRKGSAHRSCILRSAILSLAHA